VTTTPTAVLRRPPLVILSVASVVLLGLLYVVAVRTSFGQRVDEAALSGRTRDAAVQHAVDRALDSVSVSSLAIATIALVVLALLRRRPRLALGIGILVVGANGTTQFLKDTLTRPELHIPGTHSTVASFPSGHSTVAMSLTLALVLAVPSRLRVPAGIVGSAYAVVVGAATLTGAWHRPSDVLGAYLVTLAWAAGVAAVLVTSPSTRPAPPQGGAVVVDWLVILLTVVLVGAAVVMGVDVLRDARLDQFEVGRAYLAAVVAIAVGALVTLGALVTALGTAELDASDRDLSDLR
jgi:hypothetical protein